MDKIDINEVANFFKSNTDIKPARESFAKFDWEDNLYACCGASALVINNDDRDFTMNDLEGMPAENGCKLYADLLGLRHDYLLGFIHGWDGYRSVNSPNNGVADYERGQVDGVAAWSLATMKQADR